MIMQSYVPNIPDSSFYVKNQSFWTDFQHKKTTMLTHCRFSNIFIMSFLLAMNAQFHFYMREYFF